MDRRKLLAAATGLASFAIPIASATTTAQAQAMDQLKRSALMGGDFALMTSELARRNSQNPLVRNFAMLEMDEQEAIARAFGAAPGSAGMRRDHAAMLERLQAMRGPEFDAMYIQGQVQGHRELLRIHRSYASRGPDPVARAASIVAVPAIQTHLGILTSLRTASS